MSLIDNQTAIQAFIDENTTGTIKAGNVGAGDIVSLIFNDVTVVNGALQVLIGGVLASIPYSPADATPPTYTLTYSTTSRTLTAGTDTAVSQTSVAVATTAPSNSTPYGYTTSAQAAAIVTNLNAAIVDIAALVVANTDIIADVLVLRKFAAALATDLAAQGIVQL